MSEGIITNGRLAKALLEGDTETYIREALTDTGYDLSDMSFTDIADAVQEHIDQQTLAQLLHNSIARGAPLTNYEWFDTGKPAPRSPTSTLKGSSSAHALYHFLDGDIEHLDAILDHTTPNIHPSVNQLLTPKLANAHTPEEAYHSLREIARNVLHDLVAHTTGYTPAFSDLAQKLDNADSLNDTQTDESYLDVIRSIHKDGATKWFLETGEPNAHFILKDIDATSGLDELISEQAIREVQDGRIRQETLRAAALAGMTDSGYVTLTHSSARTSRAVLRTEVLDMLKSDHPKDWYHARTLAQKIDEAQTTPDQHDNTLEVPNQSHYLALNILSQLSALEEHDVRTYAMASALGLHKHTRYHIKRLNERETTTLPSIDALDYLAFSNNPRETTIACEIASDIRAGDQSTSAAFLNRYAIAVGQELNAGRIGAFMQHIASHYDLETQLAGTIIEHAKRTKQINMDAVTLCESIDAKSRNVDGCAHRLHQTYREIAQDALIESNDTKLVSAAINYAVQYGVGETFLEDSFERTAEQGRLAIALIELAEQTGERHLIKKHYGSLLRKLSTTEPAIRGLCARYDIKVA